VHNTAGSCSERLPPYPPRVHRSGPVTVSANALCQLPRLNGCKMKKKKKKNRSVSRNISSYYPYRCGSTSIARRTGHRRKQWYLFDNLIKYYYFLNRTAIITPSPPATADESILRFSPFSLSAYRRAFVAPPPPHPATLTHVARSPTATADTRACTAIRVFRPHTDTDAVRAFPIVWYKWYCYNIIVIDR